MLYRLGFVLLVAMHSTAAFAALTVSFRESIPRNVADQNFFQLEINIREIVPEQNIPDQFFSRLKFFLPAESEFAGGEITPDTERYFVSQYQTATSEESNVATVTQKRNFDGIVYLQVTGRAATMKDLLGENKYIEFRVEYKDAATTGSQESKPEAKKLNLQVHVANAAPSFEANGGHKRLDISYSQDEKIEYTRGDPAAPTGVFAVAILHELDGLALPSYRHEPDEKADIPGNFCIYKTFENGGDCVVCGEEAVVGKNYYLDIAKLRTTDGVRVIGSTDNTNTALSMSGLSVGQKYSVFMVYQPDGVIRSSCAVATPNVNLTLSELNNEGDATQRDPQCFIATAAYGTPLHHRIDELRWFRDTHLKTNLLGRWFVGAYYRFAPAIAAFVAERPWLQAAVRLVLDPVTTVISKYRN